MFFAWVEENLDPSLKGKPFIVGSSIVSTANYEARQYGIWSAMPVFIAQKLCPDLIISDSHYELY